MSHTNITLEYHPNILRDVEILCDQITTFTHFEQLRHFYFPTGEYSQPICKSWDSNDWLQLWQILLQTETRLFDEYNQRLLNDLKQNIYIIPTKGDGNCFLYSALRLSRTECMLYDEKIQEKTHSIRQHISVFIQNNKEHFITPSMWNCVVQDLKHLKKEIAQTVDQNSWSVIQSILFTTTVHSTADIHIEKSKKQNFVQLYAVLLFTYRNLYVDNTFIWAFAKRYKHVVVILVENQNETTKHLEKFQIRAVYPDRCCIDLGWPKIHVLLDPQCQHYSIVSFQPDVSGKNIYTWDDICHKLKHIQ